MERTARGRLVPDRRDLNRISVILDAEVKQALERLARLRGMDEDRDVTMSELVREAIDEYLARRRQRDRLRRIAETRGEYRTTR